MSILTVRPRLGKLALTLVKNSPVGKLGSALRMALGWLNLWSFYDYKKT
jgi:hypothetical protein